MLTSTGGRRTLQQVKELGERLVDIHGQHEHQSLLRAAAQRDLLDAYADAAALAREVAQAWRDWQELRRQRLEWEKNAEALAAEREHLQWQVQELTRLAFSAEEWDDAAGRPPAAGPCGQPDRDRRVRAGGAFRRRGRGAGDGRCVVSRLNAAAEYDPGLKEALDVLDPAQIQIQEAVYSLRHYRSRVDLDPRPLAGSSSSAWRRCTRPRASIA